MTGTRLGGVLLLLHALGWAGTAGAVEVIAHPGYEGDDIGRVQLRGVFGMRLRAWPDGTPVRVFVLADGDAVHEEFAKAILQMYPYQLRQNWDRLLYSGTGQPPLEVASEDEMLRRVAETPGAIGYVARYRVPGVPPSARSKRGSPPPPAPAPVPKVRVLHVR
jgi:hypothetical protein